MCAKYKTTVREMIKEIKDDLPLVFKRGDVVDKVKKEFGENVNPKTIGAHVTGLSDHPSAKYYGKKEVIFRYLGNGNFCNAENYNEIDERLKRFEKSEEDEESDYEELDTTFSFEKDLHEFLQRNLTSLEEGLSLIESEYTTDIGRIDILAEDIDENLVVIELKAGIAKKEYLGQILSYIASVENANEGRKVRGLMVANDFDYALILEVNPCWWTVS